MLGSVGGGLAVGLTLGGLVGWFVKRERRHAGRGGPSPAGGAC